MNLSFDGVGINLKLQSVATLQQLTATTESVLEVIFTSINIQLSKLLLIYVHSLF